MKKIILFFAASCVALSDISSASAQDTITLNSKQYISQRVETGQHSPDIELTHVLNYSTPTVRLSDFSGKLIILDFWSTGCSSCIRSFKEMEQLQESFSDQIQIVLVNHQSEDSTKKFFALHKQIRMPKLPMITEDTILNMLFPHNGVPFHVWIDKSGVVKGQAHPYYATPENVRKILNGGQVQMLEPNRVINFNYELPVIAEGGGRWLKDVKLCSYIMSPSVFFTGARPGTAPYNQEDEKCDYKNRAFLGVTDVLGLYQYAYNEGGSHNFNHANTIILDVKDREKYVQPTYAESSAEWENWIKNYSFTYDLRVPVQRIDQKFDFMKEDLKRYFGLTVSVENRSIECWILKSTSPSKVWESKGGVLTVNNYVKDGNIYHEIKNYDFPSFVWNFVQPYFESYRTPEPFIDETGFLGNVDMKWKIKEFMGNAGIVDVQSLNKAFEKYNLVITKEHRLREVLVLKEGKFATAQSGK